KALSALPNSLERRRPPVENRNGDDSRGAFAPQRSFQIWSSSSLVPALVFSRIAASSYSPKGPSNLSFSGTLTEQICILFSKSTEGQPLSDFQSPQFLRPKARGCPDPLLT